MAELNDLQAVTAAIDQKVTDLQTAVASEKTQIDEVIAQLKAQGTIPDSIIQSLTDSSNRLGTLAGAVADLVTPEPPATPA